MEIIKLNETDKFASLESNSYILLENNEYLVVDPSMPLSVVENCLQKHFAQKMLKKQQKYTNFTQKNSNFAQNYATCRGVILTHCHADHLCFINYYINADIKIYLSEQTYKNLKQDGVDYSKEIFGEKLYVNFSKMQYVFLQEEVKIIGNVPLKIYKTAGHTSDSICIQVGNHLFVGDLAFAGGGIGRVDLPTGNVISMAHSIRWLKSLDNSIICHSGHGEDFTIGEYIDSEH